MNGRQIEHAVSGVAVLCFLGAVAYIVLSIMAQTGCVPRAQAPLPAYCYEEALYTAALTRCVDKATTLAESKACREDVDRTCGITQTRTVRK